MLRPPSQYRIIGVTARIRDHLGPLAAARTAVPRSLLSQVKCLRQVSYGVGAKQVVHLLAGIVGPLRIGPVLSDRTGQVLTRSSGGILSPPLVHLSQGQVTGPPLAGSLSPLQSQHGGPHHLVVNPRPGSRAHERQPAKPAEHFMSFARWCNDSQNVLINHPRQCGGNGDSLALRVLLPFEKALDRAAGRVTDFRSIGGAGLSQRGQPHRQGSRQREDNLDHSCAQQSGRWDRDVSPRLVFCS